MLKNYFKTALRNLFKNKIYSFINIGGLAVGMAVAMLVGLWIYDELNYDNYENKNSLYKVWNRTASGVKGPTDCWPAIVPPVAPALKMQFPEVRATARISGPEKKLLSYSDKDVAAQQMAVDPSFLSMFSFPMSDGNPLIALGDIKSIVITASLSKKIFGDKDPLNKIVKLNNTENYKVSGVLKDLPENIEFQFDYLIPLTGFDKFDASSWNDFQFLTYVQLQQGVSLEQFNQKIKNFVIDHSSNDRIELFLQPAKAWHLYTDVSNGEMVSNLMDMILVLFLIACLTMLIACINFMILNTARSEKRAREVGVRKVAGATKTELIKQFLLESIVIAAISAIVAIVLAQLSLPWFNELVDKKMVIDYTNPQLWAAGIGLIFITGFFCRELSRFHFICLLTDQSLERFFEK